MKNKARIAGAFHLITFVAGSASLALANGKLAADLTADFAYVAVTLLFYQIFKPVNMNISSHSLYPYNLAPGIIGEGALTLWLLAVGLNEQRWKEQDAATTRMGV